MPPARTNPALRLLLNVHSGSHCYSTPSGPQSDASAPVDEGSPPLVNPPSVLWVDKKSHLAPIHSFPSPVEGSERAASFPAASPPGTSQRASRQAAESTR